jgi:hypothetical protein
VRKNKDVVGKYLNMLFHRLCCCVRIAGKHSLGEAFVLLLSGMFSLGAEGNKSAISGAKVLIGLM